MRTIEINYYKFEELGEDAQEQAIEKWRENTEEFAWSNDYIKSLKWCLDAFDAELKDYNIDCLCLGRSSWSIGCNTDLEITGQRLRTYLLNNYYLELFTRKPYGKYKKRENGKWRYDRYSKIQYIETCCPFTGFCADDDFLYVFREFIKNPDGRTFEELINDAAESLLQSLVSDSVQQISDEYIRETIEANEYEFTEDGELV